MLQKEITNKGERSMARSYKLHDIVKKDYWTYHEYARVLWDTLKNEKRVTLREIGCMLGVLARSCDNLNVRILGSKVDPWSPTAYRIRDIFGMLVLENGYHET